MIDTIGYAAGPRRVETIRLLRAPLSSPLLGEPITLDLMARNGFRHLNVDASAESSLLARSIQRFRNTARVNMSVARKQSIRTITDGHLAGDAVLRDVARLENARHRLAAELFWPHVPADEFQTVIAAHDIRGLMALGSAVFGGGEPHRVLRLHAEALAAWCMAIEAELDFIERRDNSMTGVWEKPLGLWAEVCKSRSFWAYFQDRVRALDDPLVQPQDVEHLRVEMPAVVLGVHEVLAEYYAAAGDDEHAARHLRLLRESGFDGAHVCTSNAVALRRVVAVRLEEPLRRVRTTITGIPDRVPRREFDTMMAPLLNEVGAVRSVLASRFGVDDEFDQSAFDQVADDIHTALDSKIAYKNDDRERSILYGSLVLKRMLTWPLSAACRRRLEQGLRENDSHLYSDYGLVGSNRVDATLCFFVDGEAADPDASLVVPFYKITDREIQLNRATGSAGVRVKYASQRLLIPRSALAKSHSKGGRITVQVPEQGCTPEQAVAFASLRALDAEKQDRLDSQARANEQEQQAVRKRTADKVTATEEAARPKVKEATEALAREDRRERELLAAETERLQQAKTAVEREHGPAVQTAMANVKRRQAWLGAMRSYLPIESPLFGVTALAISMRSGTEAVAVALGAAVVAFTVGRLVRLVIARHAVAVLAGPKGLRDAAIAAAEADSINRQAEICSAADKRRAPWKEVSNALEEEKKQIEAKGKRRLEELARAAAQERADLEQAFAERAKPIKSQLQRTVEAMKESDRAKFPGYIAARRKGFQEGSEPSSHEMKMTDSERLQALVALSR